MVDEWYTDFLHWKPKPQRRLKSRGQDTVLQKEAQAIGRLTEVLEALPRESRERVLAWLGSAYALGAVEPPKLVRAPEPVKPGLSTPALSPASAALLLVKAAAPEVKPPEPKGTYRQRRRKTARKKL